MMKKLIISVLCAVCAVLCACARQAEPAGGFSGSADGAASQPYENAGSAGVTVTEQPLSSEAVDDMKAAFEAVAEPESAPFPSALPETSPAVTAPEDIPTFGVDSSCFSEIGYDEQTQTLIVVFLDSGTKYAYFDFTPDNWAAFTSAQSLGKYYNSFIKGSFACEKIG